MPVYIRKNVNFTPQSLEDAAFEYNEDDFVQDPDQIKDNLPQPFRLIDKVLESIIDKAWSYISNREDERIAEATRDKPPAYECGYKLQDHGSACCMKSSPNGGDVVVMGLTNGLAVVQAATQHTLCTYQEENMEIVNIHISTIAEKTYLISTIDDMGVGRIFGLQGEHIYLIQTISEGDGGAKAIVSHCESSNDGEFLGLCFSNTSTNEIWLEMHKLPKEQLLRELEAAGPKEGDVRKVTSSPAMETVSEGATVTRDEEGLRSNAEGEEEEEEVEVAVEVEGGTQTERKQTEQPHETPSSRLGSGGQRSVHKFPGSSLLLKIRPPASVTGRGASKPVDGSGDIIGSGTHHLLSPQHLEQRNTIFQQLHAQQLQQLNNSTQSTAGGQQMAAAPKPPQPKPPQQPAPVFHFVSGGRLQPQGVSSPPHAPITAIIVWWRDQPMLSFYSLIKPAKEVEYRPELVWPLAAVPSASAVSPCTSLLAVATAANTLLIWDKYMGQPRPIEHVRVNGGIKLLQWLPLAPADPAPGPSGPGGPVVSAPYPRSGIRGGARLLVAGSRGDVLVLTLQPRRNLTTPLNSDIQRADEMFTQLLPIQGLPQLMVSVRQNGQVFLQDTGSRSSSSSSSSGGSGSSVCEVTLPAGYSLPTPWDPPLAVAANGAVLYIAGRKEPAATEQAPPPSPPPSSSPPPSPSPSPSPSAAGVVAASDGAAVFAFTLRSFPHLDAYTRRPQSQHSASGQDTAAQEDPAATAATATADTSYVTHSTAEKRVAALMAHRLVQQGSRREQLQSRWQQLKDELSIITQLRSDTQKRHSLAQPAFSSASIPRTPII